MPVREAGLVGLAVAVELREQVAVGERAAGARHARLGVDVDPARLDEARAQQRCERQ
jgi:hypothetical protein